MKYVSIGYNHKDDKTLSHNTTYSYNLNSRSLIKIRETHFLVTYVFGWLIFYFNLIIYD